MIRVNLDIMLAKRGMPSLELAEKLGITPANLSILKTNKGKALTFFPSFSSPPSGSSSKRTCTP